MGCGASSIAASDPAVDAAARAAPTPPPAPAMGRMAYEESDGFYNDGDSRDPSPALGQRASALKQLRDDKDVVNDLVDGGKHSEAIQARLLQYYEKRTRDSRRAGRSSLDEAELEAPVQRLLSMAEESSFRSRASRKTRLKSEPIRLPSETVFSLVQQVEPEQPSTLATSFPPWKDRSTPSPGMSEVQPQSDS